MVAGEVQVPGSQAQCPQVEDCSGHERRHAAYAQVCVPQVEERVLREEDRPLREEGYVQPHREQSCVWCGVLWSSSASTLSPLSAASWLVERLAWADLKAADHDGAERPP